MRSALRLSVDEIVEILARGLAGGDRKRILAVYVFGSVARGEDRPDSDVDLAFLMPVALDPLLVYDVAGELSSRLGRDVDLVDLRSANAVMRAQVVGHGTRIYEQDSYAVSEFEMYAFSDHARLQEERRPVAEAFLARYRG